MNYDPLAPAEGRNLKCTKCKAHDIRNHKNCIDYKDHSMPKFSTNSDFEGILKKTHKVKTSYTYTKNSQLILECNKTQISIICRKRIDGKYQKTSIGNADGKILSDVIKLFNSYLFQADAQEKDESDKCPTLIDYFNGDYITTVASYKRSLDQDKAFLELHIFPHIGRKELNKIGKNDVNHLIQNLSQNGYKPSSQKRFISCLSAVLTHAVNNDVIPSNPVLQVKKPQIKKSAREIPAFDVFKKILKAARSHHDCVIGVLVTSAIRTGARLSEVKNAKWEHIDIESKTWFFPLTKSNTSRKISIPQDLIYDLNKLKLLRPDTTYIFQSEKIKAPIPKPHIKWKKFLVEHNLPDIRFHDLRHSFATYALEKGSFTLIELRDHLGHASVSTTQIYTKASHETTAAKLSNFMN